MDTYQIINKFSTENIQQATIGLLDYLGISTDVLTEKQIAITDLIESPSKAIIDISAKIKESYLVCSISDRTFKEKTRIDSVEDIRTNLDKYEQILVFAIDFRDEYKITRTEMATLTRGLNRVSKASPVVMVCRYNENEEICFALSLCERTAYKKSGHTGEKAGKVNLLRGINPRKTHTGHIRILESMRLEKKINTFEAVYNKWLAVFDNDVLTKQFYTELQNWYFWALKPECRISFPNDINDDKDDQKYNPQNIIRLITRLIFVWFLRQKGLVPKELFEVDDLKNIVKDFEPDNFESNTYYRVILQNLFFATLNKKIEERAFVSDEYIINRNQGKHKIKTIMRHASDLKISKEEFIKLLRTVPFMNNSLFECLDNKEQNGRKYNWDGFSNSNKPDRQSFIPNYLFFAKEAYVDLSKEYGRKNSSSVKVCGILNILKRYNFTVEENTPLDQDVALDPELLGKVFENLLAAYNPETESTVRKSTGSYYTPRPIVQYMVDESLVAYLKKAVPNVDETIFRSLLSYNNEEEKFDLLKEEQKKSIANAMLNCKVLDPACGSGAFPMGMLQQMNHLLSRVDDSNKYWEEVVLERANKDVSFVEKMNDDEKEAHMREIQEVFNLSTDYPDYARKLYLIENCIYGVDLQSIAVQISRLRFFISLVCEQKPDLSKPEKNYNIKPLPNLEMKFVCANTLVSLEDIGKARELFSNKEILDLIDELKAIRHEIFIVTDQHMKEKLLLRDEALRSKIMLSTGELFVKGIEERIKIKEIELISLENNLQNAYKMSDELVTEAVISDLFSEKEETITYSPKERKVQEIKSRINKAKVEIKFLTESINPGKDKAITLAKQLTDWNPYDQNVSSPFFDADWMFGVKDGFDLLIGNPPYGVKFKLEEKKYFKETYKYQNYQPESYLFFIEKGLYLTKHKGFLSYIIPNTWLINVKLTNIRKHIFNDNRVLSISHYHKSVFEAIVDTEVIVIQKGYVNDNIVKVYRHLDVDNVLMLLHSQDSWSSKNGQVINIFADNKTEALIKKISSDSLLLSDIANVYAGVVPYEEGKGNPKQTRNMMKNKIYNATYQIDVSYRPVIRGADINRYENNWDGTRWIKYGKNLAAPRKQEIFDNEKIIIRQTGDSLIATYDDRKFICLKNTHIIIATKNYHLKYILSILNSKLMNYYYQYLNPEMGEALAEVKKENVEKLVFKKNSNQKPFVDLVDKIIQIKELDPNKETSNEENKIDYLVYKLYNLDYDEVLMIDPRTSITRKDYEEGGL